MPDQAPGAAGPILELVDITKRFGPVVANSEVYFDLRAGEIHALVGENGAGKTTLMRVLYGMYQPDGGQIRLDGAPVRFRRPLDSIEHGIGMVHQHFMLVPSFTVAENVTLGAEPRRGRLFDHDAAHRRVREPMARLGIDLDPDTVTGTLNVATQQKLEIVKVLYRGARIIILDEPTAVLTPQETDELFRLLRRLADDGASIVFISHKLREVLAVADRITVLRNGRTVQTFASDRTEPAEVVAAMTGRGNVNLGRVERDVAAGDVVLSVRGLSTAKPEHDAALDDVSFTVRAGEIVGIAGVEGNGQSVLAEALIGTVAPAGGSITLADHSLDRLTVADRRNAGLSYVSEDRHLEGLPINGTVLEGLAANRLRGRRSLRALGPAFTRAVKAWAAAVVGQYAVKTSSLDAHCATLSGGNQQKIVIARELEDEPRCLVLAQPTRGVDLGAIEFIYDRIVEATRRGCAVVLISADLDEILRLSDRVLVMYRGCVVADEPAQRTSREELGMHMMGARPREVAA
ncbi:ABC transporter ATP-binding protein [Blastococcus sp. PRF04-17]|uniref:ABC transporter ATP-binding protein n=1 Tax=Blastococcus sp. PRF04-17 TaxID=2933797 RepID=UPI001FF13D72|nr:ABC transporter ATP-binding protein [Blastococcus sp. PRF04-17]UOY03350.1 ABC transporter ATP-binding protein [Blastococcus sp. PRF04-17]